MEFHEYAGYDAVGLRELITTGQIGAKELEVTARAALARANEQVNGLALPLFDQALAHDEGGPLAGVPFLIKDIGPMAEGVPFFMGSRALGPGVRAGHDSDLMGRFRAAGLVTLGVSASPEFGLSFTTEPVRSGPVRNPWDLGRSAGGSSGARRRWWRREPYRWRMPVTGRVRSGFLPRAAGWWGSSRAGRGCRAGLIWGSRCWGWSRRSR